MSAHTPRWFGGRRLGTAAGLALMVLARLGTADDPGGVFCDLAVDVTPRIYHRASLIPTGQVLVSGGTRVQLLPQSLVSIDIISFVDPGTGRVTTAYHPPDGGAPRTPRLATARSNHTQTTLADGRVLITGGLAGAAGSSPGRAIDSVEWFDPATGRMHAGPAMSEPRAAHTATLLDGGRVLVAGSSSWQCFDPETDRWSTPRALRRPRRDHAAVGLPDGRVLLVGGRDERTGDAIEIIDPVAGVSRLARPRLDVAVDDVGAGALDDGTVLIIGGQELATGNTIARSYRYEPREDRLVSIAPPPGRELGIADHRVVVSGALAYVFGGEQQRNGKDLELDYAAVFDARHGRWHELGPMRTAHDDFEAVALPDGRVMLVGGGVPLLGIEMPSPFIELFTPRTGRPRDLDDDGVVGPADLRLLLDSWGPSGCAASVGDLDASGGVDRADLHALLVAWGNCADGPGGGR